MVFYKESCSFFFFFFLWADIQQVPSRDLAGVIQIIGVSLARECIDRLRLLLEGTGPLLLASVCEVAVDDGICAHHASAVKQKPLFGALCPSGYTGCVCAHSELCSLISKQSCMVASLFLAG